MKGTIVMEKNGRSLWVSIYELFSEFFGALLPGAFFCTYFFLCAIFLTLLFEKNLFEYWPIIVIGIIAISYSMGAIFRVSNMRGPDIASARYVYFRSLPSDSNAFAIVQTMTKNEYEAKIDEIKCNPHIAKYFKLHYRYLKRKSKKSILNMRNKSRVAVPRCLRKIYNIAKSHKKWLSFRLHFHLYTNKTKLEKAREELTKLMKSLIPYLSFSVDYPYYNLKQYYLDRGLDNLAKMITWDYTVEEPERTNRSKSFICNIKLKLRNNPNVDISLITKSEAHIRFMNSMWYATKYLKVITGIIIAITFIILSSRAFIYFIAGQYTDPHDINIITDDFNTLKFENEKYATWLPTIKSLQALLYYIQIIVSSRSLFIIFTISVVYLCLCCLITNAIKNNFHYQRLREITYLLQSYEYMECCELNNKHNIASTNNTFAQNSETNKRHLVDSIKTHIRNK